MGVLAAAIGLAAAAATPQSRAPAPASPLGVTTYSAAFFAAAQPNTAKDMIDRLPGFVFDNGDTVRGFAGAAGNVLIDGVRPTSKTDDLDNILRRIPASRVERIELIRGGAPGVDMQGKTIVANVVRKAGAATTAAVTLADTYVPGDGRQLPRIRIETARQQDATSIEGSLVLKRPLDDTAGDGPEIATAPDGRRLSLKNDNTRADGDEVTATGAYTTPLAGGTFRANSQLSVQTYTFDERDQDAASSSLQPTLEHDHQNQEQGELGLTYDRPLTTKLSMQALFIQQLQGEDYLTLFSQTGEQDRFHERHTNGESILRSTLTDVFSPNLTLEAGGEGDFNWLDSHTAYVSNGAVIVLPAASVRVKEARGELFGKATWVVDPRLTVEAGLRLEASDLSSAGDLTFDTRLFFPKPRLVLTWSPDPADQIRLRAEEEVGQLDFNDFIAAASLTTGQIITGNPHLTPQQAMVLEAAYERRFWTSGDLTFTYRHSQLKDVIDRAPVVSPSGDYDDPANIGGGTEDEFITALNLPLQPFGVLGGLFKADVTWRRSRVTDPTTGALRPLGALKPREGKLEFDQDLPQWRLKWGAIYDLVYRQPYYSFSEVEIDDYRPVVNLFAEYNFSSSLNLRGDLMDIGADFRRTLEVYPDLRSRTAQQETDTRDLNFEPYVRISLRKAF